MERPTFERRMQALYDLLARRSIATMTNGCWCPMPQAGSVIEELNTLICEGRWTPQMVDQLGRLIEAVAAVCRRETQGDLFQEQI